MAPKPNNSTYHWTAGDIVGPILFICFVIGIILLVIWKKARCCIPCCVFFDSIRGKHRERKRRSYIKSKRQPSKGEELDLEVGIALNADVQSTNINHNVQERNILSAHGGHAEPAPPSKFAVQSHEDYEGFGKGGLLEQPIMAHLRGGCAL